MEALLINRWVQLAAAALVGVVASAVFFSLAGQSPEPTLGPVTLTNGGAVFTQGDGNWRYAAVERAVDELPLTGAQAIAAGWKDPFLCSQGRGKYFEKAVGQGLPYILLYDSEDELIGIYLISEKSMPPPWEPTKEISGGAGPVIDYEHWGLFVYFRDPTRACAVPD